MNYLRRYIMAFFFVWAFVFTTATYCGDLVLERDKRFKYISHVMGLRKVPYWTANYCFDLCIFTIPLIFFFISIYAFGSRTAFLTDVMIYLGPLLLLFAVSFIGYSYLFSFMFQKATTAYRLFPFFNLIFFYVLPQMPILI